MKRFASRVALALTLGTGSALSQAPVFDASILEAGNRWTYRNSWNDGMFWFQGITRFRILDAAVLQDTLRLRVLREDSGRVSWSPPEYSMERSWSDTLAYAYKDGAFTPEAPPFAVGQSFDGTEPFVVYRSDSLRLKGEPNDLCGQEYRRNLQSVGVVDDVYNRGCGHDSRMRAFRLLSFNDHAYSEDSLGGVPVAIAPATARARVAAPAPLRVGRQGVEAQRDGVRFDLRGARRSASPAAPVVK